MKFLQCSVKASYGRVAHACFMYRVTRAAVGGAAHCVLVINKIFRRILRVGSVGYCSASRRDPSRGDAERNAKEMDTKCGFSIKTGFPS